MRKNTGGIVGERGPELLTIGTPGYVIPNTDLQAAGRAIVDAIRAYDRRRRRRHPICPVCATRHPKHPDLGAKP